MRITKIKLNNYKQYMGLQIIEIPDEGKIVVIKGENGAGKTNLINGLTWALYREKIDYESLFNDRVLFDLKIGDWGSMFIEIHFEHDNKSHILCRKVTAIRMLPNSFEFKDEYRMEIIVDGVVEKNFDDISIENYINNIMNYSVKNYFFFDGARIENFTKEDHNKDVAKAIKNLLKIETIIRAKDHIQTITNEVRSSINDEDHDGTIAILNEEIDKLEDEITKMNGDLKQVIADIQNLDKDIKNTLNELEHLEENSQYRSKKEMYLSRKQSEWEICKKNQKELNDKLNKSYLIFSNKLFKDCISIIDEKTLQNNQTISNQSLKTIIKESIDKNECFICKRELSKEDRNILISQLPNIIVEKSIQNDLFHLNSKFNMLLNEGSNLLKSISQNQKEINRTKKEMENLNELIIECDKKIDKELPDAKEYKEILILYQQQKKEVETKKRDLEQTIHEKNEEKADKESDLREITKLSKKYVRERKKLEMCYMIRTEIDSIFEQYEKTEIEKINLETKRIFDLIIRKKDVFKSIFIDGNYKLNVNRSLSKNVLNELSYGERQILSLSLILALANVSGDQGPFVMDTPMGNLDPIHRRKLLETMPKLVSQLFLLVTGSEFTEDLYQRCYNEISIQYNLRTVNNGWTIIEKEVI